MSFWELMALVGTMAMILGVFLTIYALINNRTLKEESRLTRETLREAIMEESRLTREMIAKMAEKMDETLKEIARLIVAEGEKTRQALKASS